jgi:hypothetical protein
MLTLRRLPFLPDKLTGRFCPLPFRIEVFELGHVIAPVDFRWRLDRASDAAGADAPAQPICLSQRLD